MKPASWSALGLDSTRMVATALAVGAGVAFLVGVAAGEVLGESSWAFGAALGAAASYTVASEPKRALERSAILQAREAPALAASAAVYLQSTGSRARTTLMLRSEEPLLRSLFERARRRTLLGLDPGESLRDEALVRSDSAAMIIAAVGRAQGERLSDEGDEVQGIVSGAVSVEETKFPAFLTVCFFAPIMLMLLAAIGHHDNPVSVAGLSLLEVVVLDIVLSFSSTERRRLAP